MDIQWIAATGLGAQNWFWLEAGDAWLYDFAVHFMNTKNVNIPQTPTHRPGAIGCQYVIWLERRGPMRKWNWWCGMQ